MKSPLELTNHLLHSVRPIVKVSETRPIINAARVIARTGSAAADAFVFGFALAKELKRLPFCLGAVALLEGFEDVWELAAEDGSGCGSSGLVASIFTEDVSFCNGRLAGTVDSVEGFDALATGGFTAGAAGRGGRTPVLR